MTDRWKPPYAANEANVTCPRCVGAVFVREHESYWDGNGYDAFCGDCHIKLEVAATVTVTFHDAKVVEP